MADPLQTALLLLLAADDPTTRDWRSVRVVPGKLFVVGDPKQAIYRFRRADLGVYEDVKERVREAGGEILSLSTSFRARPGIQRFVNGAFQRCFGEGVPAVQARHVPLSPARDEEAARPNVVVLPVPDPYGDRGREVTDWGVQRSFPDAVAAFAGKAAPARVVGHRQAHRVRLHRRGEIEAYRASPEQRLGGELLRPEIRAAAIGREVDCEVGRLVRVAGVSPQDDAG